MKIRIPLSGQPTRILLWGLVVPLVSLSIALGIAQAQTRSSPEQPATTSQSDDAVDGQLDSNPESEVPQARPEIGIEFEGFRELNSARIVSTEYTGECPGGVIGQLNARFISATTPPATGLRVVLRNVTRGMGGDVEPYTDREYDKGKLSEGFRVQPGTRHNSKYLALLEGMNDFEYQIKRGSSVIESGKFSVDVEHRTRRINRDARDVYEEYCVKKNVALQDCKDKDRRVRLVRKCPGQASYNQFRW